MIKYSKGKLKLFFLIIKKEKRAAEKEIIQEEMRKEMKLGGRVDKPLGSGGKKSGPPPKSGPNPQGLNIKSNTVKTVKLEK